MLNRFSFFLHTSTATVARFMAFDIIVKYDLPTLVTLQRQFSSEDDCRELDRLNADVQI